MSDQQGDGPKYFIPPTSDVIKQMSERITKLAEIGKAVQPLSGQLLQLEMSKSIGAALAPLMVRTVIPPLPIFKTLLDAQKTMVSPLGESLAKIRQTIPNSFLKFSSELVELAQQAVARQKVQQETYPVLSQRIPMLAQRGWFLSGSFGLRDFDDLAESAKTDSDDELEHKVEALYRQDIYELAHDVFFKYPARKAIIEQAIHAHREGLYALSVPVFFAQSDGICVERTKKHLFMGKATKHVASLAKEKASTYQAKIDDDTESGLKIASIMELLMWMPLIEHQPIGYSEGKREESGYSGLNRHCVLHGESLDYATELNSLKAFSLLSYLSSLLERE